MLTGYLTERTEFPAPCPGGGFPGAHRARAMHSGPSPIVMSQKATMEQEAGHDDLELQDPQDAKEEETERKFLQWAQEMGIEAPLLEVAVFEGGLRGTRAVSSIRAGTVIARLPRTSALQVADREPCPFPEELSQLFWSEASLSVKLATILLRERKLGASSSSAAFLEHIPTDFSGSPCWWDDGELEQLQDPVLASQVRETNRKFAAIHAELTKSSRAGSLLATCLPRPNPARSAGVALSGGRGRATLGDFRWAMSCVVSRSFGGQLPVHSAVLARGFPRPSRPRRDQSPLDPRPCPPACAPLLGTSTGIDMSQRRIRPLAPPPRSCPPRPRSRSRCASSSSASATSWRRPSSASSPASSRTPPPSLRPKSARARPCACCRPPSSGRSTARRGAASCC